MYSPEAEEVFDLLILSRRSDVLDVDGGAGHDDCSFLPEVGVLFGNKEVVGGSFVVCEG